jgi:hypothetical protein
MELIMSTRRMLLAVSNSSPFPLTLTVQYHSNLGGYLYTPGGQPEIEGYEKGSIFNAIRYFNEQLAPDAGNCILQYGDFTLYIWDNDVEVYIDEAHYDDDNIGLIGYDESENTYYGKIYANYGTTTLNGTTYNYSPGEIYMRKA